MAPYLHHDDTNLSLSNFSIPLDINFLKVGPKPVFFTVKKDVPLKRAMGLVVHKLETIKKQTIIKLGVKDDAIIAAFRNSSLKDKVILRSSLI